MKLPSLLRFCLSQKLILLLFTVSACAASAPDPLDLHAADELWKTITHYKERAADGSATSFVCGKTLLLLGKTEQARPHLVAAGRKNEAWSDEADWLAHTIALKDRQASLAAEHLLRIIHRQSGSSWYTQALRAHCALQVDKAIPVQLGLLLEAAGLAQISPSSRGQFLLLAARHSPPAIARDLILRGLRLELYNATGAALTREMLLLAPRLTLTASEEIELAAGLVRNKQERAALERLSKIAPARLEPASRLRLFSVRCWIQRRMRDWTAAARTADEIERLGTSAARFAAHEQRFRIAQGRARFEELCQIARAMYRLDKEAAHSWWKLLPAEAKNDLAKASIAIELLDHWPADAKTKYTATESLIQLYLNRQYQDFSRLAEKLLPHLGEPWRRAALLYHLHLSGKVAASEVILAEPLGYYHLLLKTSPSDDAPALRLLEKKMDWKELARASFLASSNMQSRIAERMQAEKSSLPDQKIILLSDQFDPDRLASLLERKSRSLFAGLVSARLWPEALDEILKHAPVGGKLLSSQSADYLIQLSRLAARASRFNVEIWATWAAIRKAGWQSELAAVERFIGKTVFSRLYPRHYSPEVMHWSRHNQLDPLFVFALIRQESGFNRSITSWAGAIGLMQLMPSTATGIANSLRLTKYDVKNPDTNIRFGCQLLRWLRTTFGNNAADILIGYNSGSGNISRWKQAYRSRWGLEPTLSRYTETIPYNETKNYIKLVLANHSVYQYLYR